MDRLIKFRGKTLANFPNNENIVIQENEWVYGGIVYDDNRVWVDTPYWGQIIVNKGTIGQFTEIYDKSGKEIYERRYSKI